MVVFLIVLSLAIFAGVLVALAFWMMRTLQQSAGREQDDALAPLRERVSTLMEVTDTLKGRFERALGGPGVPAAAGSTKLLATSIERELEGLTDTWLSFQQALEAARERGDESVPGGGPQTRAMALVHDKDAKRRHEEAQRKASALEVELARLEEAPGQAAEAIERLESLVEKARAEGAAGEGLAAAEAAIREAGKGPWGDPVGVAERAAKAAAGLEALARERA